MSTLNSLCSCYPGFMAITFQPNETITFAINSAGCNNYSFNASPFVNSPFAPTLIPYQGSTCVSGSPITITNTSSSVVTYHLVIRKSLPNQLNPITYTNSSGILPCPSNFPSLPVTLMRFEIDQLDNNLVWETGFEEAFMGFIIEGSNDALIFDSVGFVNGNNIPSYYKWSVEGLGNKYFRLKMLDNNGEYSFSKILENKVVGDNFLKLTSNFIHDDIEINASNDCLFEIKDFNGRAVFTSNLNVGLNKFKLHTLTNGGYFIYTEFGCYKIFKY